MDPCEIFMESMYVKKVFRRKFKTTVLKKVYPL